MGFFSELLPQVYEIDFNNSDEHINLGSIVPIINKLITNLKYEKDFGKLRITNIVNLLVSQKVLSLPKPYFANHTLDTVFYNMVIPFESRNNDVIIEVLDQMKKWIDIKPLNTKGFTILKNVLSRLFEGTIIYHSSQTKIEFDMSKENVRKVLDKAKDIILVLFNSSNIDFKCTALDLTSSLGHPKLFDISF